jgi:membrane-associated phospholipid phosphatase
MLIKIIFYKFNKTIILNMNGKKRVNISLLAVLILFPLTTYSQDTISSISKVRQVPFTRVLYKIDKNIVGSFKYNYGLNYLMAIAGTYGIVKIGADWQWYNLSNDHKWISNTGFVSVGTGGLVPLFVPLGIYLYGRSGHNSELQITGLALGQAAILGLAITSSIKVFTGRVPPDFPENTKDYSGDFRFGILRGGAFDGWPSSHTAVAFAMATTLIELYPDNTAIKIGSLAYASIIGLGVSTNIHWFSDAFAGALIGYAIGKTVGTSYRNLMNNSSGKTQAYNFYITPTGAALNYRF